MPLTFFRRLRMEMPLSGKRLECEALPQGFALVPWDAGLVGAHADAKYRSFRHELDANVFPCLGDRKGCLRLMTEISRKQGFLGEATWLLVQRPADARTQYCGTIQGVRDEEGRGWIQNFGVAPEFRGRGLGTALLFRSLAGFREAGLKRALLEVTAQNDSAVRLYRRLGFAQVKTLFKAIEIDVPPRAWD
jgi:GNAT superfamily N-acetyltransferase